MPLEVTRLEKLLRISERTNAKSRRHLLFNLRGATGTAATSGALCAYVHITFLGLTTREVSPDGSITSSIATARSV